MEVTQKLAARQASPPFALGPVESGLQPRVQDPRRSVLSIGKSAEWSAILVCNAGESQDTAILAGAVWRRGSAPRGFVARVEHTRVGSSVQTPHTDDSQHDNVDRWS